ncbi:MAG: alpha/beta fold hydrolase, partial [Catenulispora sp.]|nr:alpha/beta fold hydrolase [Catenulispora sp.]
MKFRRLRLTGAAVSALAVAWTGAATSASAAPATPATPPVPTLAWSDCQGGFECANAQVPLDYREPQGKTLTLAVIRKKATDPSKRKGTLFLQPGGPGNSGVDFVRNNYADLPTALREDFDVFGYDVRGVGRSSQVVCWDDPTYTRAVTAAKGVPGPGAYEPAVRQAADFDQACQDNAGDLLPYVG